MKKHIYGKLEYEQAKAEQAKAEQTTTVNIKMQTVIEKTVEKVMKNNQGYSQGKSNQGPNR